MRTKTEGVKFQNELPVSQTQPAATHQPGSGTGLLFGKEILILIYSKYQVFITGPRTIQNRLIQWSDTNTKYISECLMS